MILINLSQSQDSSPKTSQLPAARAGALWTVTCMNSFRSSLLISGSPCLVGMRGHPSPCQLHHRLCLTGGRGYFGPITRVHGAFPVKEEEARLMRRSRTPNVSLRRN